MRAALSLQQGNGSGGTCSVSTQEASQGGKEEAPGPPHPSGHPAAARRSQASALRQPGLRPACPGPGGHVPLPSGVAAASVIKESDSAVYTACYIYLQEQDVEFSFNDEKSLSKDNSLELIMYIKATI